jgi:hypothetical protein
MHDPMTVAHEIKYPWRGEKSKMSPKGYRSTFITIWHVDPERGGSDDSCGWFMRARHGSKEVLEKIIKQFEFDWDRKFVSDGTGKTYFTGYFYPEDEGAGMPNMSVTAVGLNLFFIAAGIVFQSDGQSNWKKSRRWMQKNLFDIMLFIENPTDSLRDSITLKWGTSDKREERIRAMASCIYGWILRNQRPWYRHPKWHIWHWKIQCHPLGHFKRWAFSRCCKCGKRFYWGESPVTDNWNSEGPQWFRGETDVYHGNCNGATVSERSGCVVSK